MDWSSLGYVLIAGILLALTYQSVRRMPGLFTKAYFFKTSYVLAALTLCLIAFLYVIITLLKQG